MGSSTPLPPPSPTKSYALAADAADPLSSFRSNFHIPTLTDIHRPTLHPTPSEPTTSPPCTYLCGNSLGLQPRLTSQYISTFLTQWRTKAVKGHFTPHSDSPLQPFLHIDDHAAQLMAPIVGAKPSEVAVMGTLTGNLHLLMSSFYRPGRDANGKGKGRYKILLEGKAFPSDHFAVESQIQHWGLEPADAMVLLAPKSPDAKPTLETAEILHVIEQHKDELALILLPGVQFYTGQLFDVKTITAYARERGIIIGWDMAHAAGNVELKLHEWGVDFAAWCTYKYLNCGPGAMGAMFVHERYNRPADGGEHENWPRLTGWWGDDKSGRFEMTNKFNPRPGAAGFQLSNPSALDLAAVVASLQIFDQTSMAALRERSIRLTRFLEILLLEQQKENPDQFTIITPEDPEQRGTQLSVRLKAVSLEPVLEVLEEEGAVIDERKPDVIRVAPAPLYNTFEDVWNFCQIFRNACQRPNAYNNRS